VSALSNLYALLSEPNSLWVLSGSLLLGLSAGVLGCFALLKKRALIGDTLAHAALPGVTSAFLLTGSRDPLLIVCGALVTGFLGLWAVEILRRHTRIKEDSALAIVLSFFFAVGVFQLTLIQKIPTASQAGLDKILFGQAAALVPKDIFVLGILAIITLVCVVLLFQRFQLVSFDRSFGAVIGVPVRVYEFLISLLLMLSVVIGIQLVGVVLVAALMITPAAAARYWTNRLGIMLLLGGMFGALSGMVGTVVSSAAPRMPTGPWMVVAVTIIFAISALIAPERGLALSVLRHWQLRRRIARENVIRTIFKINEADPAAIVQESQLLHFRNLALPRLDRALRGLVQRGLLARPGGGVVELTAAGKELGAQLTRKHRLWELYLTKHTAIDPEHAHLDAEEIEHLLTAELEEQLREELEYPSHDPHGKQIPNK